MAAASSVSVVGEQSNIGINIVRVDFTKANVDDTVTVPSGYGSTVVFAAMQKKSTGEVDAATAISDLVVTCSAENANIATTRYSRSSGCCRYQYV